MEHYKSAAAKLAQSDDRSRDFPEALSANGELLQALSSSIVLLEQGRAEGCFGQRQDAWNNVLEDLTHQRDQFARERDVLMKSAAIVREDSNNKSTSGKTSIDFINGTIDAQFKPINAKTPIEIDSTTLLTSAQRTGWLLTYSYRISTNRSAWIPAVEQAVIKSTVANACGNENIRNLLGLGYEYRYVSLDQMGLLLANVLVTAKRCEDARKEGLR